MTRPIELVAPGPGPGAPAGADVATLAQGVMLAAAAAAVVVLVAVRGLRPVSAKVCDRRAFARAARGMGLGADERATLAAMGETASMAPGALLLSERALRRARVAALASVTESGPLSSERIRRACAALGVE